MNEYNDRVRSETYLNCGLLRFLMIIPALIVGVFSTISFSPQFISTNNVLILSSLYSRVSIALNSTNGFFFSQIVYWMERNQSYRTHYSFSKYMIHNYTSVVMYTWNPKSFAHTKCTDVKKYYSSWHIWTWEMKSTNIHFEIITRVNSINGTYMF